MLNYRVSYMSPWDELNLTSMTTKHFYVPQAYGVVWKAIDKKTHATTALKKCFDAFRNATDAQRTYREIMYLQQMPEHENLIRMTNCVKAENDRDIYLVFEYMGKLIRLACDVLCSLVLMVLRYLD